MIRAFVVDNDRLRQVPDLLDVHEKVIWADLVAPTKEEEAAIEQWIGADIPTREEMEEIEISSRLYSENGAYFMTATLPANTDTDKHVMGPVTFVLARDRLVTVRYHEPRAFKTFPMRAESADLELRERPVDPHRATGGHRRPAGRPAGARQPRSHRHFTRDFPSDGEEGLEARRRLPDHPAPHWPRGAFHFQRSGQSCFAPTRLRISRQYRRGQQGREGPARARQNPVA